MIPRGEGEETAVDTLPQDNRMVSSAVDVPAFIGRRPQRYERVVDAVALDDGEPARAGASLYSNSLNRRSIYYSKIINI